MFEKFTDEARRAVVFAQEEARSLGHTYIGTEHLLLGVMHQPEDPGAAALASHGVSPEAVRSLIVDIVGEGSELGSREAEALGAIGISLDAVRDKVEAAFGPGALERKAKPGGHIPFTRRAKAALEASLREALSLHQRRIRPAHVLLGILKEPDTVALQVLARREVDSEALRQGVLDGLVADAQE